MHLANGTKTAFLGKVDTTIKFCDIEYIITLYVLNAPDDYVIIGCPFLTKIGATIFIVLRLF